MGKVLRIGIFYDGQYFHNVSDYYYYQHQRKARISISGLHEFIRNEIAEKTATEIKFCQIVDAHYFRGRLSAKEYDGQNKLYNERLFDDILMYENVVSHYLPIKRDKITGKTQEKGIDVWLALEAYELSIYKKFNILVLVACDGDYIPLVRKLNTLGTQVMLISWDFKYKDRFGKEKETRTAQQLLEEVSYPISMHERINSRVGEKELLINNLFIPKNQGNTRGPQREFGEGMLKDTTPLEGVRYSTIFSIKDGYGFIKDEEVNNVFFYHDCLENIDFNDLKVGMKVKYLQETNDVGKFIATKIWLDES